MIRSIALLLAASLAAPLAAADVTLIHDIQGTGAATSFSADRVVTIEGIVTGSFQRADQMSAFFVQEEDRDGDRDPLSSEALVVRCGDCTTPVVEGERVRVSGTVSEMNGATTLSASTVEVTERGDHSAEVRAVNVALPMRDVASLEPYESMRVTLSDLTVGDIDNLQRFGEIELWSGGRPKQFTEFHAPDAAGYRAYRDELSRRRILLDDDSNLQNRELKQPEGMQAVFYPQEHGGFGEGTQGVDFVRSGDRVEQLTAVLDWSGSGAPGSEQWRLRPVAAKPVRFRVANPRPASPPHVGGAIKVASANLLNYFVSIDETEKNEGPCGPEHKIDCRGADSLAELQRQTEKTSLVLCSLDADIVGFMELENTTPTGAADHLLERVNARCGGDHPYAFASTGGSIGTDAIRVALVYRTGVVEPRGAAMFDTNAVHDRPPTAQTFEVVKRGSSARGRRLAVVVNHLKSKGCSSRAKDLDLDQQDGQSCFGATRVAQARRTIEWLNATVLPTAGSSDVLMIGDFNSYAMENSVAAIRAAGFHDLEAERLGGHSYSYVFAGQTGHLDLALASASLEKQVTGIGVWHINSDEADLFDYNDDVRTTGEAAWEEKPDGSKRTPPRVLFNASSPYRASDHDPVLIGLYEAGAWARFRAWLHRVF